MTTFCFTHVKSSISFKYAFAAATSPSSNFLVAAVEEYLTAAIASVTRLIKSLPDTAEPEAPETAYLLSSEANLSANLGEAAAYVFTPSPTQHIAL